MNDSLETQSGHTPQGESWEKDPVLEQLFSVPGPGPESLGDAPLLRGVTVRMSQRRRRRRAFIGLTAAAAVLVVGLLGARTLDGRKSGETVASNDSGLTISYRDRAYTFTGFAAVECSNDDSGEPVLQGFAGDKSAIKGDKLTSPILRFEVRPDLLAHQGSTHTLPVSSGNSDSTSFILFAAVPTATEDNEASSQQETALGTVTIKNLTCGSNPTFTLSADAALGSEVSGPRIPIRGTISYP